MRDGVPVSCLQTLQMGIYHFSGLFVLLCLGLGSALLSSLGEHVFYHLALPRIRRGNKLQYWLHTSQVRSLPCGWVSATVSCSSKLNLASTLAPRESIVPSTQSRLMDRRRQSRSQGKGPWGCSPPPELPSPPSSPPLGPHLLSPAASSGTLTLKGREGLCG